MSNFNEFGRFCNSIISANQLQNGNVQFGAQINYGYHRGTVSEEILVQLHLTTMEYGKISFLTGDEINTNTVHVEFSADYQDYIFEDGMLTIRGRSARIGQYEVKITPL